MFKDLTYADTQPLISLEREANETQQRLIIHFLKPPLCHHTQEAVVQYEQYEQEVRNLQRLIEEAHRIIQDRPVSTNNIQELQAQIHHHEVREHTLCL